MDVTVPLDSYKLAAQAIQIADEYMLALIECQAIRIGSPDGQLFGLVDEAGNEVNSLIDADPAIIEAFEWLSQRGQAEMVPEQHGECILLNIAPEIHYCNAHYLMWTKFKESGGIDEALRNVVAFHTEK